MFDGFDERNIDVGGATRHTRIGSDGPPILLLHGHGAGNHEDMLAAIRDPAVVHGMIEDYRAAAKIDYSDKLADRAAGRTIECPVLVLWALDDDLENLYGDVLAVWRAWARDLRIQGFPSGHHMPEEQPALLAAALDNFISGRNRPA